MSPLSCQYRATRSAGSCGSAAAVPPAGIRRYPRRPRIWRQEGRGATCWPRSCRRVNAREDARSRTCRGEHSGRARGHVQRTCHSGHSGRVVGHVPRTCRSEHPADGSFPPSARTRSEGGARPSRPAPAFVSISAAGGRTGPQGRGSPAAHRQRTGTHRPARTGPHAPARTTHWTPDSEASGQPHGPEPRHGLGGMRCESSSESACSGPGPPGPGRVWSADPDGPITVRAAAVTQPAQCAADAVRVRVVRPVDGP